MTRLVRWTDSQSAADSELAEMIRQARSGPSAAELEALAAAVSQRVHGAPAVGARRSTARRLRWVSAALVLGGVVWLAPRFAVPSARPRAEAVGREPSTQAPPVPPRRGEFSYAPAEHVVVPRTPVLRRRSDAPASGTVPAAASRAASADASNAVDEVMLLQRARRQMLSLPAQALALANEHAHTFPDGAFREEREAVAVEALARLAAWDAAQDRFRRFVARYPQSAYRTRLTQLLDTLKTTREALPGK